MVKNRVGYDKIIIINILYDLKFELKVSAWVIE